MSVQSWWGYCSWAMASTRSDYRYSQQASLQYRAEDHWAEYYKLQQRSLYLCELHPVDINSSKFFAANEHREQWSMKNCNETLSSAPRTGVLVCNKTTEARSYVRLEDVRRIPIWIEASTLIYIDKEMSSQADKRQLDFPGAPPLARERNSTLKA
jgi:hypothetical protein